MAIVYPNQCNLESRMMASTGTQADVSDPEGVLGTITSFQEQVKELQQLAATLNTLKTERADTIHNSTGAIEELGKGLDTLLGNVEKMEGSLNLKREHNSELNQELEDLINEKERLETEAGEIHGQEVHINRLDLDNEQRLLGFVQEELLRKTEESSQLQNRFDAANQEYNSEWNEYKNELKSYEEEKKPFLEKLDQFNELTLAKHAGMQSGKEVDGPSRDLTERLTTHHFNKITHRHLQVQLMNSQFRQTDIEDEIGALTERKKNMWKRCLDLEQCLDDVKDFSDETNMLRPTSAYSNLPDVIEGKLPKYSLSSEEVGYVEPEAHHGLMLHRCHKHINIAITESLSEANVASMTTKVDAGALDIDTEKIDSSRDTNDAMPPPAPERDEPEADEDGGNDGNDQTDNTPTETQTNQQNRNTTRPNISDADNMTNSLSMFAKMRQRASGVSSSLRRRLGNNNTVVASGSTKRSNPSAGGGGRRRR